MLSMKTEVKVSGISGKNVSDFMLNCTDEVYQNWWPGVHLAFYTKRRFHNNLGNLVYFDEFVGKRRLTFEGIVVKYIPGKQIAWQLKKGLRLPAWLLLEFVEVDKGVLITHTITFSSLILKSLSQIQELTIYKSPHSCPVAVKSAFVLV